MFGNYLAPYIQVNSTSLICTSPPHPPGNTSLKIVSLQFRAQFDFEFISHGIISHMTPSKGLGLRSTLLTIFGSYLGLGVDRKCLFGEYHVEADFISLSSIRCRSVPQTAGNIAVSLLQSGEQSNTVFFHQLQPTEILSFLPSYGPAKYGALVKLVGEGYYSGIREYV